MQLASVNPRRGAVGFPSHPLAGWVDARRNNRLAAGPSKFDETCAFAGAKAHRQFPLPGRAGLTEAPFSGAKRDNAAAIEMEASERAHGGDATPPPQQQPSPHFAAAAAMTRAQKPPGW